MFKFLFLSILACIYISGYGQSAGNQYTGAYSGVYNYDSCRISMKMELKADGTYILDIKMLNANTGKDYYDGFYLIPLHTEGKWFIRRGFLFMAMKTTDTFCDDGSTTFEHNHIFGQDHVHNIKKFGPARDKFSTQRVMVKCGSEYFETIEHYTCYEFTRRKGKKLSLDVRIGADFYEQAWTGRGTYLVRK